MNDRILIVGAGAIGGMLAGYLCEAGRDVTVFARGATARAISGHGIRLVMPDGAELHAWPRVADGSTPLEPAGIVIFATKAFSLGAALAAVRPAIGAETLVAPVVNGIPWWFGNAAEPIRAVDPHGALAAAVAPDRLVGAVTYSPAWRSVETATWTQTVPGQLTLGPAHGDDPAAAETVAQAFAGARFEAVVSDDIRQAVWTKFVTNAAFNTLCALTGARQCDVARDGSTGPIAEAIMHEVAALATATGSRIAGDIPAKMAQARAKGIHKPSTLQDFEAGREVELAALVDAPLELGRRLGVPMPELARVGGLLRLKAAVAGLLPAEG